MTGMIKYIPHHEIDLKKWDDSINLSVNGLVYANSWFLDIVSPGWDALIENDYESVFPLTHNRRFGIRYLYQPYFTQQLGLFSRNHLTEALVDSFLQAIPPKFRFIQIHLNTLNKVDPSRYHCSYRINHELDMINTYENLYADYDQNTRRNLKKAHKEDLVLKRKVEPDELISLFRENYGKHELLLQYRHYHILRNLIEYCLKNTFSAITGVFLPNGTFCAGSFFLREKERVIFQLAASNQSARDTGAMFLLVDNFIRENAGQALILDFEGSNDNNVSRFYKGFGAKEMHYSQVTINRLPGWIDLLRKLKKENHKR
ncbi:MAG: GNAT family N-acetyltransferase [Bacteroidetes bacterium]|nr:GNAT family N-acetyltransferase [Bacteroidota bacterium]